MNITPATKNMKPQWKLLQTNIDQSSACFILKGNIAYMYRINTHRNGVHWRIFRMEHLSELNSDYKFSMALPILHSLEEEAKRCWPRADIHSVPLSCRIRKLSNCGVEEDSWESLGQPIKPVHPKGYHPWIFTGRTDDEAETPVLWQPDAMSTHWKRLWRWERLRVRGEGGDRGWDGWMSSWPQWTRVWANSGR